MYQMHQLLRLAPETPFQLTHEQLTEGSDPHIDSRITPIRGIAGVTVSDNRGCGLRHGKWDKSAGDRRNRMSS